MKAAILSIGDELTLGQTVDTNAAWLAARLAERGVAAPLHLSVADEQAAIGEAFACAAERADLVIATGGLGPTEDDLTRFALADAMGAGLALDGASLRRIEAFFARRDRRMSERNRVQAMRPTGAEMLENPAGTAPGIRATLAAGENPRTIYCLPGVPREMKALYERHIEPALAGNEHGGGRTILSAKINTFGAGESDVAERLGGLASRERNPLVGTTVSEGIVSVRIRSEFPTAEEAREQLNATAAEVERRLHPLPFGRGEQTLAEAVGRLLRERHRTLATAESCTAGLLGKQITDVAGAGDYYLGGWITYSLGMKTRELGVPDVMLQQHGAVSEPVALAMADNAIDKADAEYALSITGIAGPEGGSEHKPVGTVWIALADRRAETIARRFIFPGDRAAIRDRSAKMALNLLRLRLLEAG